MSIDSLQTTIFLLETRSLPSTKRSSEAENATSKRRPVRPPLRFYREDAQPAKKGQVNNVLQPRRLITPPLLTTEIDARSRHSSSKNLLLHEKLPKPPEGASKLMSFVLSLPYVCTPPWPMVFLLLRALASQSTSAVVRARALGRSSATHC